MLNKYNKVLIIAIMGMSFSLPAYSQQVDRAGLASMHQSMPGITLSINDINAEVAVGLVCEHFGYAPMFHMPLTQTISVDLKNASFDQAMEKILGDTPTDYMLENGRLHVFKPRESWSRFSEPVSGLNGLNAPALPKEEPVITRIIPLGQRTAADVQKLLKELNPGISIVHDIPTNSIIAMGKQNLVEAAEVLCKDIDALAVKQDPADISKMVKSSKFITETFELEHADFEEVEKELSNIIERDSDSSSSSSSSSSNLRDSSGNLIESEYFLLDKARRVVVVHTSVEKYQVIKAYFDAINKPLPQVLIEASIVAVDDGLEKELGIKWNGLDGTSGYSGPAGTNPVNNSLCSFFQYGGTWNFSSVQALLNAVEKDNNSQILSRPRVVTVTGKTSSIHVGDEIPYSSGTSVTDGGTTTSNIEFKEVGIKLDVTPIVNIKDNTIQLSVIPEVSQWVKDVVMGSNIVPQVSTRRSESTIKINNGETMVIGGLIESKTINGIYEVPLLNKIPFAGRFFKNKTTKDTKTNLIILLTARIVDDNNTNSITSTAIRELNEVKPLRKSELVEELSRPAVDTPKVYGEEIEWPKTEEVTIELDRGWQFRPWMSKKPVEKVEEIEEMEDAAGLSFEEEPDAESSEKQEINVRTYLQQKLNEIRQNRKD